MTFRCEYCSGNGEGGSIYGYDACLGCGLYPPRPPTADEMVERITDRVGGIIEDIRNPGTVFGQPHTTDHNEVIDSLVSLIEILDHDFRYRRRVLVTTDELWEFHASRA